MEFEPGKVIWFPDTVDSLIEAVKSGDAAKVTDARQAVLVLLQWMNDELVWLRDEKQALDTILTDLRNGGDKDYLVIPTGEHNHRYLYKLQFVTAFVDNTHPDGEPVP